MLLSTRHISRFIFLIALTLIIEMIGLPQPFTGPLINMMLILTSLVVSPLAGVILGALTPLVAAIRGQLPGFLVPIIPFIFIGNAVFVLLFSFLRARSREKNIFISVAAWCGVLLGAFVKFVVLYYAARFVLPLYFGTAVPDKIVALMSFPQFFTAVAGGVFAFLIYNMLQIRFHLN